MYNGKSKNIKRNSEKSERYLFINHIEKNKVTIIIRICSSIRYLPSLKVVSNKNHVIYNIMVQTRLLHRLRSHARVRRSTNTHSHSSHSLVAKIMVMAV